MALDKKKVGYIVLGLIILAAIIGLYFYFRTKSETPEISNYGGSENSNDNNSTSNLNEAIGITPSEPKEPIFPECPNETFPLKLGSCGGRVEQLQTWLLRERGALIKIEGFWDNETDAAIQKFLNRDNISKNYFYKVGMDKMSIKKW